MNTPLSRSDIMRLKCACYSTNISMSVVGNLSPVLFLTFRELYGISFSLLGLLVLINFVTQLIVDLAFSFFSHRFNIPKAVKMTPFLTVLGMLVYALWPFVFPNHVYAGLVVGTVIFSASGGFCEVLISPVIAAIPSDDPDREMSKLHSIYAWGVVFVIIISTLFLLAFGGENWQWLALLFTLVPITASIFFSGAKIPHMETPEKISGVVNALKDKTLWLCVFSIFLGGASECTMAQWSSGYLEQALGIPKVWGDIFGVALFALTLGLGRTLYAKMGKNIGKVLFAGAVGATVCYLLAAVSSIPLIGLIACAFTGFCTSMMWPGNLIAASEFFPSAGVFLYAMMAAGGDLGASVGPQLIGVIADAVIADPAMAGFAQSIDLLPEQLGMKIGMLVGMIFPLIAVFVFYRIKRNIEKLTEMNK
ncbi:MAG: MFS transporter [Ruminococcaceae bacterium]|nr:MFS transporter [Oscillospiraceae bacterium]